MELNLFSKLKRSDRPHKEKKNGAHRRSSAPGFANI